MNEPIVVMQGLPGPDPDAWPPQFQRWAMEKVVCGILRSGDLHCVAELDACRFTGRWLDLVDELAQLNREQRGPEFLDQSIAYLTEPSRRLWDEIIAGLPTPTQEIRTFLRKLGQPEKVPETPIRTLVIWTAEDIPDTAGTIWRAEKRWPSEGFCMIVGSPGVGKTMFMIDTACRIVCGEPTVDGKATIAAPCCIVEAEGGVANFDRRLKLFMHGRKAKVPLVAIYGDIRLGEQPMLSALKRVVHDYGIKVLFLDPISLLASIDENKNDCIRQFISSCILPFVHEGLLVVALHHVRKWAPGVEQEMTLSDIRGGYFWAQTLDLAYGFSGSAQEACSSIVLKDRLEPVEPFTWKLDNLEPHGVPKMAIRPALNERVAAIEEAIVIYLQEAGERTKAEIAKATKRSPAQIFAALKLILATSHSPIELISENRMVKYRLRSTQG